MSDMRFPSDGYSPELNPDYGDTRGVDNDPDFEMVRYIDNGATLDVKANELTRRHPNQGDQGGQG